MTVVHRPTEIVARAGISSKIIPAIAVVLTAVRLPLFFDVTTGIAVAILLLPLWAGILRRSSTARVLLILGVLAWANGAWLTALSSTDHTTSATVLRGSSLLLAGIVLGICVVVWARSILGTAMTGFFFGIGMTFGVNTHSSNFGENPWKFGYSIAITVVLLSLALLFKRKWLGFAALLFFAALSTVTDARSMFAILLLAAVAVGWQLLPGRPGGSHSAGVTLVALTAIGVAVYNFGQSLIVDGYLGQGAQLRTLSQEDASGSLLLGGRPELAATTALFLKQPWGFGNGTIPTLQDITVAKTGMAAINYQPNNGYVENYMFGGKFELHSMVGDLWAAYGFGGIVLAAAFIFVVIRSVVSGITTRSASALVCFLAVELIWNIAFSPLLGSSLMLILLLGLVCRVDGIDDPAGLVIPIKSRRERRVRGTNRVAEPA